MTRTFGIAAIAGLLLAALPGQVAGMGEEEFGNRAVHAQPEWSPGVLDIVNDTHRVYRVWVNGNEDFFFQGDADALNAALEAFARVAIDVREVIVLPTPGRQKSFDGKTVSFDWSLKVPSGIYLHVAREEKCTRIHARAPVLTIHAAGGKVDPAKLRVPKGLAVLMAKDLAGRCLEGLRSEAYDIRGYAAGRLAKLAYLPGAIGAITKALDDSHEYVLRSAALALGSLGNKAERALPVLKKRFGEITDKNVRSAIESAIKAIEAAAAEDPKASKEIQATLRNLDELRKGWEPAK
jgi:tetratricopeptide (TPR) repeat protein